MQPICNCSLNVFSIDNYTVVQTYIPISTIRVIVILGIDTYGFKYFILLALMGALVNSMVHTIMYTYYGLTAFGPSIRKHIGKYKKRVTQLQLVRPKHLCVHTLLSVTNGEFEK